MNYFDIAILAVILLFAGIGLWKGFIKTGLSLLALAISILIVYFLGGMITDAILSSDMGADFIAKFNILSGEYADKSVITVDGIMYIEGTGVTVAEALSDMGVPKFLQGFLLGYITDGASISYSVNRAMASYAMNAIVAVAVFIIVAILMRIVRIVVMRAIKRIPLSAANRIAGGLLYAVIGFMFVCAVLMVFDLLSGMDFMSEVNEIREGGVISSWLSENNPLKLLFGKMIKQG